MRPSTLTLLFASSLLAAACNDGGLGTPDGGGGGATPDLTMVAPPDMTMPPDMTAPYPAPHSDLPQVADQGGPTLKDPRFVPVFFAGDDASMVSLQTDFLTRVGATDYWKATTSEYGVGAGTATMPIMLTEMAPANITDSQIQTWLTGKLNANDPTFPTPDPGTIYVLTYPAGTTITLGTGTQVSTSCQEFGAYHSDTILDNAHNRTKVSYAVIPRCDGFAGMTTEDSLTASTSHELIEAVTDPFPNRKPAYAQVDGDHIYWMFLLGGGETGDMCAQDPTSFVTLPELPYMVQRTWSNAAAAAGHDPCVPAPSAPFFNATAVMNDTVTFGFGGSFPGVIVPVGQSKTIDVQLYSDRPTSGLWTVTVEDAEQKFSGGPSHFTFKLDRNLGRNGDVLKLTITSVSASSRGGGVFIVKSRLGQDSHYTMGPISQSE